MSRGRMVRTVLVRFGGGAVVVGAVLFGTAGTLRYWEGWAFLATLFLPMAAVVAYFLRRDPAALERRLAAREDRARQKTIVIVSSILWLVTFLLPGFDHRFGWSSVPPSVVILADAVVFLGYLLFFLTLRENSFAARVVRVEEGQRVITTGPYALVRHPMYLGISAMLLAAPVALGSWWALIPALTTPFFLAARIADEEEVLRAELAGYGEYVENTRYRMIPGLW